MCATAKPTKKKKKTIQNRSYRTDRIVGDSAWRRGVAARVASRDPSASRAYARAAALAPNDAAARGDVAAACAAEAEALLELGDAVGARRAVVTAERCLRAGLRLHPADPALWTALGTLPRVVVDEDEDADADAERDARRRDRARRETALARRPAALAPSRAPAWAALGRLYLEAAAEEKDVGDGDGDGDGAATATANAPNAPNAPNARFASARGARV